MTGYVDDNGHFQFGCRLIAKNSTEVIADNGSVSQQQPVHCAYTYRDVHRIVLVERGRGKSYRQIARDKFEGRVTHSVIQRIAAGKEPKTKKIREALGIPAMAPAPVCPKCGIVHVAKRCTSKPPPNRWADYPIAELRRALENRQEMDIR